MKSTARHLAHCVSPLLRTLTPCLLAAASLGATGHELLAQERADSAPAMTLPNTPVL